MKSDVTSSRQNGNVLFYILIAVALLAALSFAITQTGYFNAGGLTKDKIRLYATEIVDYSNAVSNAVSKLRLSGVSEENLCFDSSEWPVGPNYNHAGCSTDSNKIFHPDGGRIIWAAPPSEAMDSNAAPDNIWHFNDGNEIELIGSSGGADAHVDLTMMVKALDVEVCRQINTLLGVENPSGEPPTDTESAESDYTGSFTADKVVGDEDTALSGRKAACFEDTTAGQYIYYRVLLAR